jgi:hypothetical protein
MPARVPGLTLVGRQPLGVIRGFPAARQNGAELAGFRARAQSGRMPPGSSDPLIGSGRRLIDGLRSLSSDG